jgi:SAM-dependent methyltransferase
MVNVRHYELIGEMLNEPTVALFQQQWQLYRKFVDNNYFYHREVYGQLHRILVEEAVQPFRFLDIACGDARATVDALKGTRVEHYHGIDLSEAALDLASKALETLACPVTLDQRDFVAALRDRPEPVDVAWIGLSLHHLLASAKLLVNFCRSIGAQASGFPPRILRTPRWSFRRHFVPIASTYAGDGRPRIRR